jgi:hypothetical protein
MKILDGKSMKVRLKSFGKYVIAYDTKDKAFYKISSNQTNMNAKGLSLLGSLVFFPVLRRFDLEEYGILTFALVIIFLVFMLLGDYFFHSLVDNSNMKWTKYMPSAKESLEITQFWRANRGYGYFIPFLGFGVGVYFVMWSGANFGTRLYFAVLGGILAGLSLRTANPVLISQGVKKLKALPGKET